MSPDFYLSQQPSRNYTAPHNYPQIIVPLNDLERRLVQHLGDLMEWWIGDPEQAANLNFLVSETFQQFGDCYDQDHITFVSRLNGNMVEKGNVPGYPVSTNLHHFPIVQPNLWSQYVTIFRHYSWELFALVNNYANQFPSHSLVFHKWISGGLVFYITPRTVVYDLG